jgi:hypothetical protein
MTDMARPVANARVVVRKGTARSREFPAGRAEDFTSDALRRPLLAAAARDAALRMTESQAAVSGLAVPWTN